MWSEEGIVDYCTTFMPAESTADAFGPATDALFGAFAVAIAAVAFRWLLRRCGLRQASVASGLVVGILLGPLVLGRSAPATFHRFIAGGTAEQADLRAAERLVEARRVVRLNSGLRPIEADPEAEREAAAVVQAREQLASAELEFGAPRRAIVLVLAALAIAGAMGDPSQGRRAWSASSFAQGAWLALMPLCLSLLTLGLTEGARGTALAFAIAACTACAAVATGADRALAHREETGATLADAARFATLLAVVPLLAMETLPAPDGTHGSAYHACGWVAVAAACAGLAVRGRVALLGQRGLDTVVVPALTALIIVPIAVASSMHWFTAALLAIACSDGRWLGAWIGARLSRALGDGSPSRTALAAQGATNAQLGFTGVLAASTLVPVWGILALVAGGLYLDATGRLRFAAAGALRAAEHDPQ